MKSCYIWGEDLTQQCDRLPAVDGRVCKQYMDWYLFTYIVLSSWMDCITHLEQGTHHSENPFLSFYFQASMVHSLIHGYGLLSRLKIVQASQALYGDLKEFHSEGYLNHLKIITVIDKTDGDDDNEYMPSKQDEKHGIGRQNHFDFIL